MRRQHVSTVAGDHGNQSWKANGNDLTRNYGARTGVNKKNHGKRNFSALYNRKNAIVAA